MRAIFFYPLAAIASAALIAASFGPALDPPKPAAQTGTAAPNGVLVFGPEALTHVEVGDSQVAHVSRDGFLRPSGMQIATKKELRDPNPAVSGVRLVLNPAQAAQFAGKPLRVNVRVRPLPITNASALAVSAQVPGPYEWVSKPLPAEAATALSFSFPAIEGTGPEAIGFWPVPTAADYNYGVEIVEVRLSVETRPITTP
jgi:hypothetical protein